MKTSLVQQLMIDNVREIKFRAWDKDMKKMRTVRGLQINNGPLGIFVQDNKEVGIKLIEAEFDLMQYTNLKDKNGKEIYEGDGFMDEEDGTYNYVVWNDWYGGWGTNEWFTPEELVKNANTLEIIGNIYENPDLIK